MPKRNQPLGGNEMPRFGGPGTMMRLPAQPDATGLDVCFVGVPMDIGTSNRPGTRYGPRHIRLESALIRPYHMATRAAPFDSMNVADIGDVAINTFDLKASVDIITAAYDQILQHNCTPLTLGGDHTLVLPILRAMHKKYGPVGLIQIDAHTDINDKMFGEAIAHGTPIRRAIEEGLVDPRRTVQIGIRGTLFAADELDWARQQGVTMINIEEFYELGLDEVIARSWQALGTGPCYVTVDVDVLDPAYAPGTGGLEPGGMNVRELQGLIRGLAGLKIAGADVVEVSPPLDPSGNTALVACNLTFELLCLMATNSAASATARS